MYIESTNSTNTLMKTLLPQEEFFTIWTGFQTAGRGQAGNGWESEAHKNLTFSVLLCPEDIDVSAYFRLNMLVSLAVVRGIEKTTGIPVGQADGLQIKWPNDIYIGDKKICGILIENILGTQTQSIAGIGLNVNQQKFVSNAPNPSSLRLETGHEYELEPLLNSIIEEMTRLRPQLGQGEVLKREYMSLLYRREGYYPYLEREVNITPTMIQQQPTKEMFEAKIVDILNDGSLLLERKDGEQKAYHFKQIRYVIC